MKFLINNAKIRDILAVITIILSFVAIFVILHFPIPPENKDLVNVAFGLVMGSCVSGVIGYYFGASKQPDQKHE